MLRSRIATAASSEVKLRKLTTYRGIRVLTWDADVLYASRGYQLVRSRVRPNGDMSAEWEPVAHFHPAWWRNLTSRASLTYRLMRDGFHALVILKNETEGKSDGTTIVGAIPGAIVTRSSADDEFRITHQVRRGTRPLHITAVPSGQLYWGEYFDNRERTEVHIYASADRGRTWQVAYTFPAKAIRHIHNIVYDRWADCLWILTGDDGAECKVLRASCDLRSVGVVLSGNQQARAAAAVPMPDALYLSTDTPFETNHVLRIDRANLNRASLNSSTDVEPIATLASSSIYGCHAGNAIFFSTMIEPSPVNRGREVHLTGSSNGSAWRVLARWHKDSLPLRYFQYGNAVLPDGDNATDYLAATTIAVEHDDLVTTLWEVA